MRLTIRNYIPASIFITLFFNTASANAQISLLQRSIDQLESFNNISYHSIERRRDASIDTSVYKNYSLFVKTPADTTFGYLFRLERNSKTDNFIRTDLYDGKNTTWLNPRDSTFHHQKDSEILSQGSVMGSLRSFLAFLATQPNAKVFKRNDSNINGKVNEHLYIIVSDTVINKKHLYQHRDFFIDKKSGLPTLATIRARNDYFGGGVMNDYYNEVRYFDYILNQTGINTANFKVPKGFHAYVEEKPPVLLKPGTVAPNWTLSAADGKKNSLFKMRGKVVLLDFYFIGCFGCMQSLKPLNVIYEKYKEKGVVMASINERDKANAILAFEKQYHIEYPGYINAATTVKSYGVSDFPTFYFIDKKGKIGHVFVGYSDDFESKVTSIIDSLLKN